MPGKHVYGVNRNEGSNPFLSATSENKRSKMIKYSFKNDYSEGAHPRILEAIVQINHNQDLGYGYDQYSLEAANLIKSNIKNLDAEVYFVSGGTQANLTVISALLKPYESIIAADTGHIAVHETGAIEATGHKVNTIKGVDGKLTPNLVEEVLNNHSTEHMVKPKAVFISNSTELGTIYNKAELYNLSNFCKQKKLLLYLDGARLGSALSSEKNDLTLAEISQCVDVFYIGGTKSGALLGEAIVINNDYIKDNFKFYIKQKGALLAKGRLLGIQFVELFKDDLFFQINRHANNMAMKLANGLYKAGYQFFMEPVSNQIFPILPNEVIAQLSVEYDFSVWSRVDANHSVIRLVTSWATLAEMVDKFILDLPG